MSVYRHVLRKPLPDSESSHRSAHSRVPKYPELDRQSTFSRLDSPRPRIGLVSLTKSVSLFPFRTPTPFPRTGTLHHHPIEHMTRSDQALT
jgi:hypothetical protein